MFNPNTRTTFKLGMTECWEYSREQCTVDKKNGWFCKWKFIFPRTLHVASDSNRSNLGTVDSGTLFNWAHHLTPFVAPVPAICLAPDCTLKKLLWRKKLIRSKGEEVLITSVWALPVWDGICSLLEKNLPEGKDSLLRDKGTPPSLSGQSVVRWRQAG